MHVILSCRSMHKDSNKIRITFF
uniref:Uncharacterized protein n=1 Tax=Arundo donax TaxID=35708 RepID=A0A0A9HQ41_ARUDO